MKQKCSASWLAWFMSLRLPLLVVLMAVALCAETALAQTDDIFVYPGKVPVTALHSGT
jgi:hypothetical protein